MALLLRLSFLVCGMFVFAACGVRFTASEGNEFFTAIDVTGEMATGAPLTGSVAFDQTYPAEIIIRCELRQRGELVAVVGEARAVAHPAGNPEATPVPGNFAFDFMVQEPGTYVFQCYTPRDEENFIEEQFDVTAASGDAAPTISEGDPAGTPAPTP